MTKFLLAVHVLAAIIAIGPITVAASMFPAVLRRALADPPDPQAASWARLLHRICRVYAVVGVAVPVFGLATASSLGVLTDAWLLTSMALTAIAALLLILAVLPRQAALAAGLDTPPGPAAPTGRAISRLGMVTGLFNLLWAIVTVLMIVRPGSTTGA
ncbi:hypothetical protein [Catenuloplanes atrovinosus]|uniref:Uncharacterized protein n=1 Tax=Catenuloplanes atrovinosus TaxID=137266 RepID=A0AAE4C9K7_9ACTN|nr:hypothetical protein [Catenuloplanes atrovinosus]MDR7273690.1 hypothetical protein [Catenuloplanes atrovinosus]